MYYDTLCEYLFLIIFSRLLQQLLFEQQKTNIGSLVDYCCDLLSEHKGNNAQLLVIVSDGRGIFNEGEAKVKAAVRRARLQGIFTVFIIIDNPKNKVCCSLELLGFFYYFYGW